MLLCDCQSLSRSIRGCAVRIVRRKSLLRVCTALRELGEDGVSCGYDRRSDSFLDSQEAFRDFPQDISQLAHFDCQIRVPRLDLLGREVFELQVRYQPVVFRNAILSPADGRVP
jgi:hypothetical protein